MSSTTVTRRINAPRATVYRALVDARAVATWMVPAGMSSQVHTFESREGGKFRIVAVHDRLPPGLSAADNEMGWRSSLGKLAELVEGG